MPRRSPSSSPARRCTPRSGRTSTRSRKPPRPCPRPSEPDPDTRKSAIMVAGSNAQQIIIKKKKKGGHQGEHHAGAWKVAYADFVTAMMAFFLLLWLLNVTTDEQRRGLADYFDPGAVARSHSGS